MSLVLSRKVIAAFVGVFFMGAGVGALVMKDFSAQRISNFINYTGDPASNAARINQKYVHDYHLTAEEQARIAPLVREMTQHLYEERRQFGVAIIKTLDDYHEKISVQMTPEQSAAYSKVNEERKKWLTNLLLSDPTPTAQGQK